MAIDNLELVSGDARGISSSTENSLAIETAAYQGLAAGEVSVVEYAFDVVESSASGEELSRIRSSVVITIEGANDPPTVVPFSLDVSQNDAPIVLDLRGQSNDPDGTNTLVIENVSQAMVTFQAFRSMKMAMFSSIPARIEAWALGSRQLFPTTTRS